MTVKEIEDWIRRKNPANSIAISDDGMMLVEIEQDGSITGEYLEVGGIPPIGDEGGVFIVEPQKPTLDEQVKETLYSMIDKKEHNDRLIELLNHKPSFFH